MVALPGHEARWSGACAAVPVVQNVNIAASLGLSKVREEKRAIGPRWREQSRESEREGWTAKRVPLPRTELWVPEQRTRREVIWPPELL